MPAQVEALERAVYEAEGAARAARGRAAELHAELLRGRVSAARVGVAVRSLARARLELRELDALAAELRAAHDDQLADDVVRERIAYAGVRA